MSHFETLPTKVIRIGNDGGHESFVREAGLVGLFACFSPEFVEIVRERCSLAGKLHSSSAVECRAIDFSHSQTKREPCRQILLPHIKNCLRMHSKNIGRVGWVKRLSGIGKFFPATLGTRTACTCWG